MERIAQLTKQARDETFAETLPDGRDRQPHLGHRLARRRHAWTTRRTTSSRSCSAAASAWSTSRTKPASDTPPRCPVWGPPSDAAPPPWPCGTWLTPTASSTMGSNMAENHPIAFRFVVEAQRRGATVIHVDPRFTRTSALADIHAPIRSGSRHRVPRRHHPPHPRERPVVPRLRAGLHEHRQHHRGWLRRPRAERRRVLRLRRGARSPTSRTAGSTRARPCRRPIAEHRVQTQENSARAATSKA